MMMKPVAILVACAALALALFLQPVRAQDTKAGDLVISQPWSRATPGGARVAGGYLTITNNGLAADRLIGGRTDAAARVEIHEMALNNGVMTMRPIGDGLAIAPGKTVSFAPGGYHLMFIDIKTPLRQRDRFPVALSFEKAGDFRVDFVVQALGATAAETTGSSHQHAEHAAPPPKPSAAADDDSFFQHIHGDKAMANVTIAPARAGPVVIMIQLETSDERPLTAKAVTVTLTQGASPISAMAEHTDDDQWRVALSVPTSGRWDMGLDIQLSASDRVVVDAPILIK